MDMGQCNDAYGAIRVAVALAEAFDCGVNDLPLTLVLSWYEQKAVSILLTLLHLGIRGIYLGPTLPAFVSPGVLDVLVREFDVRPHHHAGGGLEGDFGVAPDHACEGAKRGAKNEIELRIRRVFRSLNWFEKTTERFKAELYQACQRDG